MNGMLNSNLTLNWYLDNIWNCTYLHLIALAQLAIYISEIFVNYKSRHTLQLTRSYLKIVWKLSNDSLQIKRVNRFDWYEWTPNSCWSIDDSTKPSIAFEAYLFSILRLNSFDIWPIYQHFNCFFFHFVMKNDIFFMTNNDENANSLVLLTAWNEINESRNQKKARARLIKYWIENICISSTLSAFWSVWFAVQTNRKFFVVSRCLCASFLYYKLWSLASRFYNDIELLFLLLIFLFMN